MNEWTRLYNFLAHLTQFIYSSADKELISAMNGVLEAIGAPFSLQETSDGLYLSKYSLLDQTGIEDFTV